MSAEFVFARKGLEMLPEDAVARLEGEKDFLVCVQSVSM